MSKSPSSEKASDSSIRVYGSHLHDNGIGDMSPFVNKLLTFLKMTKTDYEYVDFDDHVMGGSPKGKIPWMYAPKLLGEEPMGDSSMILQKLSQADPDTFDLDAHLSPEEKAVGLAIKTMMEESHYFAIMHLRSNTADGAAITIPLYFRGYHWAIQKLARLMMWRGVRSQLNGQGTGKLTEEEITTKAQKELQACSDFLGDKNYLMGEKISSFDATFFAFLVGNMKGPWNHPICQASRKHQNLVDYVERMLKEFWS